MAEHIGCASEAISRRSLTSHKACLCIDGLQLGRCRAQTAYAVMTAPMSKWYPAREKSSMPVSNTTASGTACVNRSSRASCMLGRTKKKTRLGWPMTAKHKCVIIASMMLSKLLVRHLLSMLIYS